MRLRFQGLEEVPQLIQIRQEIRSRVSRTWIKPFSGYGLVCMFYGIFWTGFGLLVPVVFLGLAL
jgi:hypothetical protein